MAILPASRAAFSMFTSQKGKKVCTQISAAGLLGNCGADSSIYGKNTYHTAVSLACQPRITTTTMKQECH